MPKPVQQAQKNTRSVAQTPTPTLPKKESSPDITPIRVNGQKQNNTQNRNNSRFAQEVFYPDIMQNCGPATEFQKVKNIFIEWAKNYHLQQLQIQDMDGIDPTDLYIQNVDNLMRDLQGKTARPLVEFADLEKYFEKNGYFIKSGWYPRKSIKEPYVRSVSLHKILDIQTHSTKDYFKNAKTKQQPKNVPVLYLGKDAIASDIVHDRPGVVTGNYCEGRVLLYIGNIRRLHDNKVPKDYLRLTLSNEMGHAYFEKVLGFKVSDQHTEFQYKSETYSVHELHEAFSDYSSFLHANPLKILNMRLSGKNYHRGYHLAARVFREDVETLIKSVPVLKHHSIDSFLAMLNKADKPKQKKIIDILKETLGFKFYKILLPAAKKSIAKQHLD